MSVIADLVGWVEERNPTYVKKPHPYQDRAYDLV